MAAEKKVSMGKIILFTVIVLILLIAAANEYRLQSQRVKSQEEPAAKKVELIKDLEERKLDGPVLMYYDNGQLKAERIYKNAKLNGAYRMYYDNGQLKLEGTYKDDKMDGTFRHYNRNGQLQSEEVYRDNILVTRKMFNS